MKKFLLLALIIMAFTACDSNKVYQRYEGMPNNSWARGSVVNFEVTIEDPAVKYDVELAIRHTTYYAWANIMVNLTSIYPSGEERTMDYDFMIKEKDGSFLGEGAGDLWDINFPLMKGVNFPEKGTYKFSVNNIMPITETDDIMEVGLIVKKAE